VNTGTVFFNAVPLGTTCSPQGPTATGHTIIVGN
jgi:hypothetical protein